MTPPGEEEFQRILGFRASLLSRKTDRAGGSEASGTRDRGALVHPIAWVRWRIAIRRGGPYVPDFAEFRRNELGETPPDSS